MPQMLKVISIACLVAVFAAAPVAAREDLVRIGITPVFLDDRAAFVQSWGTYLERRLGRPVEFVQRRTYREVTELILDGKLDAAWICGFPFVKNEAQLKLLVVPLYRGEPLYQSYLIVPANDDSTRTMLDLEGKVFAYSDPDSNSGFLVPQVRLLKAGKDPQRFFSRSFFSWAHRDVVRAVADGVANAGAVDGYVWDTLKLHRPDLVNRTRVVQKSEKFGFPPFVARPSLPVEDFAALQSVMLEMGENPKGRALLEDLNLDGFSPGDLDLFDGIRRAARRLSEG
jgi:phosphonate transport system substrate-binding protein